MLTVIILKDVLDGIEHFYGKDGLEQVANFASMQNRSRESNRVIDALEALYGPFDAVGPPRSCGEKTPLNPGKGCDNG